MNQMDTVMPALLTKTQNQWLQNKIQLFDGYQRKIKVDVRKLKIFIDLDFHYLLNPSLLLSLLIVTLLQLIVT